MSALSLRPRRLAFAAGGLVVLTLATAAVSLSSEPPDENRAAAQPAPLFDGLGNWSHAIGTDKPLAQKYFDQGLMFCYGFNHKEAIRSFTAAAEVDPQQAMAWWGIAFAHGPNINAPMAGEAVSPAWAALQRAMALREHALPRHRAYIEALAQRYSEDPAATRAELDAAYAAAMGEVARHYPDDLDAAVLHADAVMNTMAWDYWLPDLTPKPAAKEVMARLDQVLAREPNHPGANHAYIHLIEAGPEPWRGLGSAERLVNYAPDSGHLLHMPSHIYIRTGRYAQAVEVNEVAAEADRGYIAQCQAQGFYPGLYYPHNLHFLWYALSFDGRSADSLRVAREVSRYAASPLCGTDVAEAPRLLHLPLIAQARYGRWDDILAVTEAPSDSALDRLMWHYVRARAFAARGDAPAAQRESAAVAALAAAPELKAMDTMYLPATGIGAVAKEVAAAKAAGAAGDEAGLIAHLEKAVAAEKALPYMEPAFWYYPTRQTLAAALLEVGRAKEAEQVFRADLAEFPRNGWSLFGLAEALRAQGRTDEARLVNREFAGAWSRSDVTLDLAWF